VSRFWVNKHDARGQERVIFDNGRGDVVKEFVGDHYSKLFSNPDVPNITAGDIENLGIPVKPMFSD
jgi:hypothetical protein